MKYLIGCDPEVFIQNPNRAHKHGDRMVGGFIPAAGLIPGFKHEPHRIPYGAIQVDGMAAEFNTDPAATPDEFVKNVREVLNQLRNFQPGYNFVAEPSVLFDDDVFGNADDESKELGCNPDFCAWTGRVNDIDREIGHTPLRTGSGHIHIGWADDLDVFSDVHFKECCDRVKQLDYYVGVYTLLWDRNDTRRTLYGKAGAFRPKPYGLEYRVPSNRWLMSQPLQRWLFRACVKAMQDFDAGKKLEEQYGDYAQIIIDSNEHGWPSMMDFETGLPMPPKIREAA